jgi:hypothetical protein
MKSIRWCGDDCVVDLYAIFNLALKEQVANPVVGMFVLWISSYCSMLQ